MELGDLYVVVEHPDKAVFYSGYDWASCEYGS